MNHAVCEILFDAISEWKERLFANTHRSAQIAVDEMKAACGMRTECPQEREGENTYLEPPEEVGAGADLEAVVVEVLAGGLDLGPFLGSPGLRVKLPYLPPHEVVQAEQVGVVRSLSNLKLPHLYFSCAPSKLSPLHTNTQNDQTQRSLTSLSKELHALPPSITHFSV